MKNFFESVLEWKNAAALMFSASIIICALVLILTGESSIPIPMIASLLVVSSIGTFLQFIAFTDRIIKKMPYTIRVMIFTVPFLALLAANAWIFRWFGVEEIMNWMIFAGIYLVVFVGGTISFEIYYLTMGKKYNGLLGQYRKEREMKFNEFKKTLVDENERQYGEEIREKYGDQAVEESNDNLMGLSKKQYDESERLRIELEKVLKAAFDTGDPGGEEAQKACELHKKWLCVFYPDYNKDYHRGLGEMYVADERFRANYDKLAPGCTDFLRDAINIYCED